MNCDINYQDQNQSQINHPPFQCPSVLFVAPDKSNLAIIVVNHHFIITQENISQNPLHILESLDYKQAISLIFNPQLIKGNREILASKSQNKGRFVNLRAIGAVKVLATLEVCSLVCIEFNEPQVYFRRDSH